ncbi:MAG: adenosyl-hopene transferase HpnH [Oligoflexia bacterium]|nr:adenosyl-hopene transferase HpnH [Oligoflexia bacterium]
MAVPLKQAATVGSYIFKQKMKGNKRYPLVLMVDPLYRCNLACAGCGKIQYPEETLKKVLTVEQVLNAIDECGVPMVNIAGGEPLIHPQIKEMVEQIVARKKFLYVCTNALLLKRKLDLFTPSPYLTFTVHMDGIKEHHDHSVCREGTFDTAIEGIKEAKKRGFRVTTNTTVFEGHPEKDLQKFFDQMMELGVDGMMISPGYSYEKAPVQDKFLKVEQTRNFFRRTFSPMHEGKKKWVFNHSPFYLDFLEGKMDYQCTPWSMPNYNIFGWQRPCYLFSEDGYAKSFKDLMENTNWEKYGRGRHPKCDNCMTHCGYEGTAVADSMGSMKNMVRSMKSAF